MNPFVAPGRDAKASPPGGWLAARSGLIVFVAALAVGLAAVGWHAEARAKAARRFARLEAQARAATLRGQFRHAVSALEMLWALARQSGGAIPNFQKAGADLRAAWPELATLELEPNGVVSDIVPRAGYERMIGFNVLKDPAQFPSAQAAIQRRAATPAGPLKLYRGEPGIVLRAPIFQRARDGREVFWGFVAVSMRLTPQLARTRTDELQEALREELGGQDLGPNPVPAPRGGWIDKRRAALESAGVLLLAGLFWALAHLLRSGSALEAALAEADRRTTSLAAERKQTQEDLRGAKEAAAAGQAQLRQTGAALRQAESKSLECQARLEANERANRESVQALHAKLEKAEHAAQELQGRLDAAVGAADRAAREAQAELEQTRQALRQAQETIQQLQARPAQTAQSPAPAEEPPAPLPVGSGSGERGAESGEVAGGEVVGGPPEGEAGGPPVGAGAEEGPAPSAPPAGTGEVEREAERVERGESNGEGTGGLTEPEAGAEENRPAIEAPVEAPAQEPAPPPDKPKAGPEAKRKKSRREAEPDLFSPPVNPAQLRKAVNQILPLLAGQDPGAKDCLADNRAIFKSAFAPEAYAEFEQCIKKRDFDSAQEQLKKAAKKHGVG